MYSITGIGGEGSPVRFGLGAPPAGFVNEISADDAELSESPGGLLSPLAHTRLLHTGMPSTEVAVRENGKWAYYGCFFQEGGPRGGGTV